MTENNTQDTNEQQDSSQEQSPVQTEQVENKEQSIQQQENSDSNKELTPEEINWKRFREARENDRKKRESEELARIEAEKKAKEKDDQIEALQKAITQAMGSGKNLTQAQQQEIVSQLDPDDIPTGGQVSSYVENTVKLMLEKQIAQQQQVMKQENEKERLRSLARDNKDFDKVCSTENLDYLEFHYPSIASAFNRQPDTYEKWNDIYQTVKKLVPNLDLKNQQDRAASNLNKPQSMSSPGVSQTSDQAPQNLDASRRAEIWKRMQRKMKGLPY